MAFFDVPLHKIDAFHDQPLLIPEDPQHLSVLAFVIPRPHSHRIVFFHMHGHRRHTTSGANDTILTKFRSRNSLATGPNTRVPRGFIWSLTITTALSSKRTEVPSSRR